MEKINVGVYVEPSSGGGQHLRLEFSAHAVKGQIKLEQLHPDKVGNFARVFRGRMGMGNFWVPVAIKLQRDQALTREKSASVTAKFNVERRIHLRLQAGFAADPSSRMPIARYYETGAEEGDEADVLGPSILCRRASHALTPCCPNCGKPLQPDDWSQNDDERRLRCGQPTCDSRYALSEVNKEQIRLATVQKDFACLKCPCRERSDKEECRTHSVFLNFCSSRLLVFELLDIDLDTYLAWCADPALADKNERVGQRFKKHLNASDSDSTVSEHLAHLFRLRRSLALFGQILAGVEFLHERQIAHLDLKPHNICVQFQEADAQARVIDLGLADHPHTPAYLRQVQEIRDMIGPYSAPELRAQAQMFPMPVIYRKESGKRDLMVFVKPVPTLGDTLATALAVEDAVYLDVGGVALHAVVRSIKVKTGQMVVHAELLGEQQQSVPRDGRGTLNIDARGADFFSLGLLLLALLQGNADLAWFHGELEILFRSLKKKLPAWIGLQNRELVHALVKPRLELVSSEFFEKLTAASAFGPASFLAEELIGAALRCTLRGLAGFSSRAGSPTATLRSLRADCDRVCRALRSLLVQNAAEADRQWREEKLEAWRRWLTQHPDSPPPVGAKPPFLRGQLAETLLLLDTTSVEHGEGAAILRHYQKQKIWLLDHLASLSQGRAEQEGAAALPEERLLGDLLRFVYPFDLQAEIVRRFLDHWKDPMPKLPKLIVPTEKLRAALRQWQENHADLIDKLQSYDAALAGLNGFFALMRDCFRLEDGAIPESGKTYRLPRQKRQDVHERAAQKQLVQLEALKSQASQAFQDYHDKIAQFLKEWDLTNIPRKRELAPQVSSVRLLLLRLQADSKTWHKHWLERYTILTAGTNCCLNVLNQWDDKLAQKAGFFERILGRSPNVEMHLAPEPLQAIFDDKLAAAIQQLARQSLGPAVFIQANIALADRRAIVMQEGYGKYLLTE